MRRCITILCVGLLAVVCRGVLPGTPPTVAGEMTGELKLFSRDPDFLLPWKLTFSRGTDDKQTFAYKIDAASTRLVATGRIDLLTGEGSWRIEEGRVDVAVWLSLLAPQLGPVLSGASAQGTFTISGEGPIHQGQAAGALRFEWRDGMLTHATQGWTLDGITFKGEFAVDVAASRLVSTAPFTLKVGTISHPRFGARNLSVQALLTEQRTLSLLAAQVEVAGGEMFADPCEVALLPLVVDINLRFQRVGLQDIVMLVPSAGLADARGRIDGVARLKWSEATDFQVGVGKLSLRNDEPAIVRLTPSLGLLTTRLPQYFDLLPSWMGPLARWMRPENPAFENMRSIELGKSELRVKTLEVQLSPEGDEQGRSAKVRLVAQPEQSGTAVKEVTFDVNVAGPLNQVLKIGLTKGFSFNTN